MESEFDPSNDTQTAVFLVQVKQDADAYLDKIVCKDCREKEAV